MPIDRPKLLLCAVLALTLTACSKTESTSTESAASASEAAAQAAKMAADDATAQAAVSAGDAAAMATDAAAASAELQPPLTAELSAASQAAEASAQLAKRSDMRFQVEQVLTAMPVFNGLVSQHGGFVLQQDIRTNQRDQGRYIEYTTTGDLIAKLPSTHLQAFLNDVIRSKMIVVLDEQSYGATEMRQAKVEQHIALQQAHIDKIGTNAAQAKANLREIKRDIDWSEVHLQVYQQPKLRENPKATPPLSLSTQMRDAAAQGTQTLTGLLVRLLAFWPLLLLVCVALFWFRRRS